MAKKINLGATIALDGEKEYRQAVSNINSTVKTLKSEMKLLSAEFGENQNSIEALSKKDEVLTKQFEAQKEKIEVLKKALENAKELYGENDTKVDKWQQSLNNAQADLFKLDQELKMNSKYLKEAKDNSDGCATSIDEFGKEIKNASDNTDVFSDVLKANLLSEAIVGGIKELASGVKDMSGAIVDTVKDTAAYADEILTLSTNTGIATDTLQELKYMEELTDTSLELLTKSMEKNIKSMSEAADGSEKYASAYEKLGVKVTDANGELRNSEDVFWECIDALGEMKNETERDSTAMELFGKSAQDLNSVIKLGSEGVKKFADEAEAAGAVLDEKTLKTLGEADDTFQRFDQTVDIVKRNFGIALAPAIERATNKISTVLGDMDNDIYKLAEGGINVLTDGLIWIMDNGDTVISLIGGIATGLTVYKSADGISKLVDGIKGISDTASSTKDVVLNMGKAIASHPWETAAIAVGVVTTAIIGIAIACQDSESETSKLLEECKKINDEAEESMENYEAARKAREENLSDAEAEAGKIEVLVDKLYELADKENKSNQEMEQMKVLIEQINELYPGLNLAIDENTGSLNKSHEAMNKVIESMKETLMMEAAEENLKDVAKELYETEMKLSDATEKQTQAYNKLKEEVESAGYTMEWFDKNASNRYYPRHDQSLKDARDAYDEITEAVGLYQLQHERLNEEFEKVNKIITDSKDVTEEHTESIKEDTDMLIEWKGQAKEVSTEVATSFFEVSAAYEEMQTKAQESIHSQLGLFDSWNSKIEMTAQDILNNLESQITGMEQWSENMQLCADRGINQGLLQELADMGPKAAGYFEILANMTDDEISNLNSSWQQRMTWEENVSKEMADIQSGISVKFEELTSSTQEKSRKLGAILGAGIRDGSDSEMNATKNVVSQGIDVLQSGIKTQLDTANKISVKQAVDVGINIAYGVRDGIRSKMRIVKDEVTSMANEIIQAFNKGLDIHSPSKKFEQSGEYSGDGYLIGAKRKFDQVNNYLKNAVNVENTRASINQLSESSGGNMTAASPDTASLIAAAVKTAIQDVEWKINYEKDVMGTIISDTIVEAVYR